MAARIAHQVYTLSRPGRQVAGQLKNNPSSRRWNSLRHAVDFLACQRPPPRRTSAAGDGCGVGPRATAIAGAPGPAITSADDEEGYSEKVFLFSIRMRRFGSFVAQPSHPNYISEEKARHLIPLAGENRDESALGVSTALSAEDAAAPIGSSCRGFRFMASICRCFAVCYSPIASAASSEWTCLSPLRSSGHSSPLRADAWPCRTFGRRSLRPWPWAFRWGYRCFSTCVKQGSSEVEVSAALAAVTR